MTLQPSYPGIPQEALPYIHFLPAEDFKPPETDYQVCRPLSLTKTFNLPFKPPNRLKTR